MRLRRDTLGTWPNVQDSIQGDLTTTQRALDDLQAQVLAATARLATIETKVALGGPIIQPNGTVRTFYTRSGSPTVPFGGATPAAAAAPAVLYQLDVAALTFTSLNTTPLTLVAGVPGKVIIPLICVMEGTKAAGTGWTNGNTTFKLVINAVANQILAMPTMGLAGGASTRFTITSGITWNTIAPVGAGEHFTGKPLKLATAADITNPGGATAATVNLSLVYYLTTAMTLFT